VIRALSGVIDLLLPSPDVIGARAAALAQWQRDDASTYCHRCGASIGPGGATDTGCAHCRDERIAWHSVTRLSSYKSPMREWILAMKFGRRWGWCAWFGEQLADALPTMNNVIVVPVPLHWRRRMVRGFDQSVLIARAMAKRRGWPCAKLITRVRPTQAQSRIQARARRHANVRGAFAIEHVDLAGWTVVLVDDIRTSGATAGRCARLLRRHGARRIQLAVAAAADPKGADFSRR